MYNTVRSFDMTGLSRRYAAVAQLVEQWTENPCVLGSNPSRGTTMYPPVKANLRLALVVSPRHPVEDFHECR